MATAAMAVTGNARRPRRHTSQPRLVVEYGGRELDREQGQALRLSVSERIRLRASVSVRPQRLGDAPERQSVERAMLAVEDRLVRAFWTIHRQPLGQTAPKASDRCGLEYFHDRDDVLARFVDAAGGKWDSVAPKPSLPSARAIDDANAALEWLLLVDDEQMRRLLVVGATAKRGDVKRRIPWPRIRSSLAGMGDIPQRTLQWRYREALRIIVNELTLARLAR